MEAEPALARRCLDSIYPFGDLERPCIRDALEANPPLRPIIPLYDVRFTRGGAKLWFYDDMDN